MIVVDDFDTVKSVSIQNNVDKNILFLFVFIFIFNTPVN